MVMTIHDIVMIFRMDHDADDMENICYALKCRTKGRRGYYRAGPALEGTPCGLNKVS